MKTTLASIQEFQLTYSAKDSLRMLALDTQQIESIHESTDSVVITTKSGVEHRVKGTYKEVFDAWKVCLAS